MFPLNLQTVTIMGCCLANASCWHAKESIQKKERKETVILFVCAKTTHVVWQQPKLACGVGSWTRSLWDSRFDFSQFMGYGSLEQNAGGVKTWLLEFYTECLWFGIFDQLHGMWPDKDINNSAYVECLFLFVLHQTNVVFIIQVHKSRWAMENYMKIEKIGEGSYISCEYYFKWLPSVIFISW